MKLTLGQRKAFNDCVSFGDWAKAQSLYLPAHAGHLPRAGIFIIGRIMLFDVSPLALRVAPQEVRVLRAKLP